MGSLSKNNCLSRIVAQRKVHNGLPTIFVNDKPIHAISAGFHFRRDIPCSMSKTNPDVITMVDMPETAEVIDTPDLTAIERNFTRYFNEYPDVLGSCLISLGPSMDWVREHPDEMTVYDVPFA